MKKITLFLGMLICTTLAFSQERPCPNILSHGYAEVDNTGNNNCTAKVYVYASGDISSQKSLRIQVYSGSVTGPLLADACFIVPGNTTSNYYETPTFAAACNATIVYVITRYTASNGTCSGGECGTTITVDGGPLPMRMSAFYAKRKSSNVGLSWTTDAESNAKEFIVQRKTGNDFIDVATVAASNRADGGTYTYSDVNSFKGVSQYRLKLIDQNGSTKYSEISTVKGTSAANDFTIFPNPSSGNAKVTITDISEPTDVQLIDNSGRILKVVSMNNSNTADFNNLQKGMYMIRIINKNSGESLTKKLNVVN
jgi:hypothetical protein